MAKREKKLNITKVNTGTKPIEEIIKNVVIMKLQSSKDQSSRDSL